MARPTKREISDQEWEACEADYRRGETTRALSAKYDIPEATVRRRFAGVPVNTGRKREIVRAIAAGKPPPKVAKLIEDGEIVAAIADSEVMANAAKAHATIINRINDSAESAPLSLLPQLAQGLQRATEGFRSARELDPDETTPGDIWKAITGRKFEAES